MACLVILILITTPFLSTYQDACLSNRCMNDATCQTGFTHRGYRCLCSEGFHGEDCEEGKLWSLCYSKVLFWAPIQATHLSPHFSGYTWITFFFWCILDIDECDIGTYSCSDVSDCINTKGSYSCTCKQGYEGDGWNCSVKLGRF